MPNALNTTAEIEKHPTKLALLPIGATEQHSLHLPLCTDSLLVEAVAKRVAPELDAYCLPTLPFSVSHMHRGSRGTVWLRNATLTAVVRDLALSLRHEKFTQLAILNGHGGNFVLVPVVQDLNLEFPDFLAMTFDVWDGIPESGMFEGATLLHADEFETSLVLHLKEEAVQKSQIRDQVSDPSRELLRYLPFRDLSKLTHTGKPSAGTAEKGRKAMDFMVERVVRSIRSTLENVGKFRPL